MQSSALQDLAHPLLEFQALTKVLLRKWRDVRVDQERSEHRRALKGLHLASNPERPEKTEATPDGKKSRVHNPEKWRRLGFDTESPAAEFDEVGFLGLMDLTDFVRRHEDGYQKVRFFFCFHTYLGFVFYFCFREGKVENWPCILPPRQKS
jgi:engulfment/cell motility protein 1